MLIHVGIACLSFYLSNQWNAWWQIILLFVVAGHSLTCMGFVAHELSHGMIVKSKKWTAILERLFWSTVFVSPTMWRRTHNSTHHMHYSTILDSDRMFVEEEATKFKKWYALLFYPNAEIFPWNPLVFLYQVPYFTRNTIAAFLPGKIAKKFVPSVPRYRSGDAWRVFRDILIILVVQFAFLAICQFNWTVYLPMMIGTQLTSSVIVMA